MANALKVVANPAATNSSSRTVYADMNRSTFEGRILHAEEVTRGDATWVSVHIATVLSNGADGVKVTFTNSNGILERFRKGQLPNGRRVFVHGHIADIRSHYEKDGNCVALKRPEIRLHDASLDLGALPRSANRSNSAA